MCSNECGLTRACPRAPRIPLSTSADIEHLYGEHKSLTERKPFHSQPLNVPNNRSFSATPVSSAITPEKTAIEPDGPEIGQRYLIRFRATVLLERTPLRRRPKVPGMICLIII